MQRMHQQAMMRTGTSPLYNQEAVREILARATELEQEDQEQLSAAQIEALGKELGIRPEAVRRALGERTRAKTPIPSRSTRSSLTVKRLRSASIPGMCVAAVMAPVFLCLITAYPHDLPLNWKPLILLSVLILPILVALRNGRRLRDWRLGLISGMIGAVLLFAGIGIGATTATQNPDTPGSSAWAIAFYLLVAFVLVITWGGAERKRNAHPSHHSGRAMDR